MLSCHLRVIFRLVQGLRFVYEGLTVKLNCEISQMESLSLAVWGNCYTISISIIQTNYDGLVKLFSQLQIYCP